MQEQINNPVNNINVGEAKRNGSAIASIVLSLVSIVLCPILLTQILGLVFGVRGLKSEKKGHARTGIIISTCTILLGLFIVFYIYITAITDCEHLGRADIRQAENISKAVIVYMLETNDPSLNGVSTVDELIELLTNRPIINGTFCGPILIRPASEFKPQNEMYKGWEVIVYKDRLNAQVSPSKVGDSLVFIEHSKPFPLKYSTK